MKIIIRKGHTEYKDSWIPDVSPCDAQALLLSTTEGCTTVAQLRIISIREVPYEIMHQSDTTCRNDLLAGDILRTASRGSTCHTERDVFVDAAVKKDMSLADCSNMRACPLLVEVFIGAAVKLDVAFLGRVKSEQQLSDSGLSGTRSTDNECHFAGWKEDGDIRKNSNIGSGWISECEVGELEFALACRWSNFL
jgi:hypothetical protein